MTHFAESARTIATGLSWLGIAHVRYGKQKGLVGIDPVEWIEGKLSPKARALVLEWAQAHQAELKLDWELARQQSPLNKIAPLE